MGPEVSHPPWGAAGGEQRALPTRSQRHRTPTGDFWGDFTGYFTPGSSCPPASPRESRRLAPTCREPLLDEGEAVAGADELDVAAGERAALAGELHGQRGRDARPLRQLEAGQQRAHACGWKAPHGSLTSPQGHAARPAGGLARAARCHGCTGTPRRGQEVKPLILPSDLCFLDTLAWDACMKHT